MCYLSWPRDPGRIVDDSELNSLGRVPLRFPTSVRPWRDIGCQTEFVSDYGLLTVCYIYMHLFNI